MADKTVTVRPSGGDYTSLAAAITGEVAANANLTAGGMNGILTISIEGTWSSADSNASRVYITGFTVDSTHYVNIVNTATGYVLEATAEYLAALQNSCEYTRIKGIRVKNTHALRGDYGIASSLYTYLDSCSVIDGTSNIYGITIRQGRIINCVVCNIAGGGIRVSGQTYDSITPVYNNTVGNVGGIGIQLTNTPIYLRNNYSGGNTGSDYAVSGATVTWQTNYSEDGTGTTTTAPYSTATFTSVTDGSEDFSLVSGSALIGAGTDLSADATYPFDWDITGATRTTWDVGAHYYASAVAFFFKRLKRTLLRR